jgi:hypothetical protein
MSHRFLRAPALALFAVLLIAGPALSKVLGGTDGPDILIGTKRSDQINGKGDPDVLKGKGGNDTYIFENGWGQDTALIETRRGGKDTLDFSAVDGGFVGVIIVREFDKFEVFSESNDLIGRDPEAGIPYIETIIGGQGEGDAITTGGGPQTLNPGGGGTDILQDLGGYDDGAGSEPAIPASNDSYMGFSSNTGTDTIRDHGGTDVVDLRPTSSSSVTMARIDSDGENGTEESLQNCVELRSGPQSRHQRPVRAIRSALKPARHGRAHREAHLRRRDVHGQESAGDRGGAIDRGDPRQADRDAGVRVALRRRGKR